MATATAAVFEAPMRPIMETSTVPTLPPAVMEVAKQVLALRIYHKKSNGQFYTHKSERFLLAQLGPADLANVLLVLAEAEKAAGL